MTIYIHTIAPILYKAPKLPNVQIATLASYDMFVSEYDSICCEMHSHVTDASCGLVS